MKACPNCNKEYPELIAFDAQAKQRLQIDLGIKVPPNSVCPNCFNGFNSQLARDAQKKNRRQAKEQHRLTLWRSRVQLIREARDRFAAKDYPGSVVNYEKYFRVLEIIYEVKPNEIQVAHFNNSARSKELVVIASAYWDLMRIYDQSKKFSKRLDQCAEKLGEFLPFTPIFAEISRKVEDYRKTAKNKDPFDKVLRIAKKGKGRCFIATASFQNAEDPVVKTLCEFRDEILITTKLGRLFVQAYYKLSPSIAKVIEQSHMLQKVTRQMLAWLASQLSRKYNLKRPSK
jgi:hypothetical protein